MELYLMLSAILFLVLAWAWPSESRGTVFMKIVLFGMGAWGIATYIIYCLENYG